jgi:subtilisin family serine protease
VAGIVKQAALLADKGINLKIMALKYLDSSASGRTSNAIRAIDYAISKGAMVISNSWGSFGSSTALSDAIGRAQKAGILFTAAAGNGDANGNGVNIDKSPFYPAADPHSNVISVAASDSSGILAGWSNYGAKNVDLGAPGVSILSARNGNTYARLSGTSMATPYISGLAAMLWAKRPDLSAHEIRNVLLSSVDQNSSYAGKVVTGGSVNWSTAVQVAAQYKHDPSDTGLPAIVPSDANQCAAQ